MNVMAEYRESSIHIICMRQQEIILEIFIMHNLEKLIF